MKKKTLTTIFVLSACVLPVVGCGKSPPESEPRPVLDLSTRDGVLESIRESEFVSSEVSNNNIVINRFSNGAVATITTEGVTIELDGKRFEYTKDEYIAVVHDKQIKETPTTSYSTEAVNPTETTPAATRNSYGYTEPATTEAVTQGLDTPTETDGTWVYFDDGRMKHYGSDEQFHYVDATTGKEYTFNYNEWQAFWETGKIPPDKAPIN